MRIVVSCEYWDSKWSPIVLYAYSSIVLEHGSYKRLVCTVYAQQQLRYNADLALRVVGTSQLLVFVLACLVTSTMLCYFQEVGGMTTL